MKSVGLETGTKEHTGLDEPPAVQKVLSLYRRHCHGDFAVFSSKWLKYLTKNLFSNMKFL